MSEFLHLHRHKPQFATRTGSWVGNWGVYQAESPSFELGEEVFRLLVKGFKLSYHNKETVLNTKDPCYGSLN